MPVLQVGVWLIPRICDTSGAFHAAECTFHTGMRLKQGYIYISSLQCQNKLIIKNIKRNEIRLYQHINKAGCFIGAKKDNCRASCIK